MTHGAYGQTTKEKDWTLHNKDSGKQEASVKEMSTRRLKKM